MHMESIHCEEKAQQIPTSKQRSWYQNFLPQCGTSIRDMPVDLAGIIVRSISNKSWLSKNIPNLENRNFSTSCWHPRLRGLSRVTTWSPTDGTHMPCEAVLQVKIKHVKRKLDTSRIECKSALLKGENLISLPLIFMSWYAHHLNTAQNAVWTLHYLSLQDSDVHFTSFETNKPDSLSLEQAL